MQTMTYILVMAVVTYLIRALPFTLFQKKVTSPFFRSFLYYVPYAVLAAMTIPAIFYSTGSFPTALVGFLVGLALSYVNMPLIVVALLAAAASFAAACII